MKKGFIIGLATGVVFTGASLVLASTQIQAILNDGIKVTLDGQVQEFRDETTNEIQYPITYNSRTYLPLRTVANLVGVDVDYDEKTNTAMLKCKNSITDPNYPGINEIDPSGFRDDKPIIYIYPIEETELNIRLGKPENIICSYPKYKDGWDVIAYPNGDLLDLNTNRKLYALYWEGKDYGEIQMNDGFVVKGEESAEFLEEKLRILGLNDREAEEFIIYWLPKLEANEYNFIRFMTMEEINNVMPLEISKTPDTLIRILMQFKGIDKKIDVKEQKLEQVNRNGFTIVEWGGTEVK